jgi:putative cell wall-binding protein
MRSVIHVAVGLAVALSGGGFSAPAPRSADYDAACPTVTERLAGVDRFGTAVAVSQKAYPDGASIVYVASAVDFPDALSAAPIAALNRGPLLLTRRDSIPAAVLEEIARLKPSRIVIVGGASAVGAGVASTLASRAAVHRIAGPDRFATSRKLADETFATAASVYVATARDFADALSAGAAAAAARGPVLLVDGRSSVMDPETAASLSRLNPTTVTLVGGTQALSGDIEQQIRRQLPGVSVVRRGGSDRFATSAEVAREFGTASHAYIASGETFPDALVGSAIAGKNAEPLLITEKWRQPDAIVETERSLGVTSVTILGGAESIDERAVTVGCLIPGPPLP